MAFSLHPIARHGWPSEAFDLHADGQAIGRVLPPMETLDGEALPWAVCLGGTHDCAAPPAPLDRFLTEFDSLAAVRSFLGIAEQRA